MLKIFEGVNRVAQVDDDSLAHIALDAPPHQKQAGGGETCRDQKHREQEAGAQPHSGQQCIGGLGLVSTDCGFLRGVQGNQRTNLYPIPCTVRKCTGLEGSFSSFWRSLRMWLSTVRVDG